jgi:hypothetical protein
MKKIFTAKEKEILLYCLKYIKQMWASSVAGMILDCDFRDAEYELSKIQEELV